MKVGDRAGDLDQVKNYVSGDLYIILENLTSLDGCPKEVNGAFDCSKNMLTSLEGGPEKVTGDFECIHNQLTSFEHFPKYIGNGCAIGRNNFTSFKDIDQHIEFIGSYLNSYGVDITSGFSDLFGIEGLQYIIVSNLEMQNIINKYLPTKDLINFQDEMIKSGYESFL